MTTEFNDLNLHPHLEQALVELGYTEPTPIQAAVIPVMLTGQDVIGQAQTGSGKTAAFSLPTLQNLTPKHKHIQAIVITPTRELAMQVTEAMLRYGQHLGVRVLSVYGGQPYARQIGQLKKGVDIVVGTPGRLLDLIRRKALKLGNISTLILDEADEMLSMGFIEDIESILAETPDTRQIALFSATMPKEIRRLADQYLVDPHTCTIKQKQLTVDTIEQRYYLVNESDKLAALTRLFEVEPITSALIFSRTRLGTGELANALAVRGFPAEALNGDMSQEARERVLNRFRQNKIKVLVATDVAARGLDIDDISHVFNYDIPLDPEVYVHRVGRTGRAGKTGIAISLLTPNERWRLRKIETYAKQKIAQATLPTVEDIQKQRKSELVERMMVWLRRGRCHQERAMVEELMAEGHDLLEIAAAAVKLARAEEKQRPIASISEVKEKSANGKPRRSGGRDRNGRRNGNGNGRGQRSQGHEAGMVRLSLNLGKASGVRPNDVVGALASHANIPGHTIGKIRIQEKQTLVDIPEALVEQVLAKTGRYYIRRQSITVERA